MCPTMVELINGADSHNSKVRNQTSTLIIGCGNLLRGDDAIGPVLIRRLWQRGLPPGCLCADGGTGGMDVAFQMRNIPHVILVDASKTNSPPGSIFEIPGEEVEQLPPLTGINTHSFRWDHALAFGRWLLKDDYPERITVYLIEGERFEIGEQLSDTADRAVDLLIERIYNTLGDASKADATLQITSSGYLQVSKEEAEKFFPENLLVVLYRNGSLLLLPTRGAAAGGLILKQHNARGDRCMLLTDILHFPLPTGVYQAFWNDRLGGLVMQLPERS
ncbi:MAG: hydrogenase maturation protease [Pirellulales bacterium]